MLRFILALTAFLVGLSASDIVAESPSLAILPGDFTLHGRESRQQISVAVLRGEDIGASVPLDALEISSSDPEVARVVGNLIVAQADGSTTITASSDDLKATVTVTVKGAGQPREWNFRNDVQSILARKGCNMGACHGALAGKGGFRLSLRGYDPDADHFAITRQTRGRRVELSDPGRSLLLAKPTGALPHKGGLRLDTESRDYKILSEWIAAGAKGPSDADARLVAIRVSPEQSLLRVGNRSQILVSGVYDDGKVVDVTQWAQFSATDEAVAAVDEHGSVTINGSGEGAVLVWFGSRVALARLTVPYDHDVPDSVYANAPRTNFIDDLTLSQLSTLKLKPSPTCDDGTFLRRATLDTIGRLPTLDEQDEFFTDDVVDRRERLIERLLAGEDFVNYWTYKWSDLLLVSGTKLRPLAVEAYYKWIREAVEENRPWDQVVQQILTATGMSNENGATNFYAIHQTPEDMTENACQAFLGLSIGCARCHNHPLEKWTNDQYYAMANLFSRVRAKGWGGDPRNGDGVRTLYVSQEGELIQPNRGKPQPPAPLDSEPLDFDDPVDRRIPLAEWITDPDNPYFARSITNRVWANFFSRGLVEEVDDLRLSNPASNEPLLDEAASFLVDAGFDLKQLMRAILRSQTYQRSSIPLPENRRESKYLSRYYPRRLMAEVLLDSIDDVLQTTTIYNEIGLTGAGKQATDAYPEGTRAIELYDSAVKSYFLKTFGRNPREITCECERSDEPSMVQVLHLSNGDTLNPKLAAEDNLIDQMIAEDISDEEAVTRLFRLALMRQPTDRELKTMVGLIAEAGDDRATALQDVAWSILTSTEFTFNH